MGGHYQEKVKKGEYVCEKRTYEVYLTVEYERNGEGSYVVETQHSVQGVGKLCFYATRRYKDIGRLINHAARGHNLKLGRPQHVRGKWRLGMVALRDISPGEELTFDYGVRSQPWMRAMAGVRSCGEDGGRGEAVEDGGGKEDGGGDGCSGGDAVRGGGGGHGGGDEVRISGREGTPVAGTSPESGGQKRQHHGKGKGGGSETTTPHRYKRNYFWCAINNCASGSVQKVSQHLQKVHKLDWTLQRRQQYQRGKQGRHPKL